jgi:hypothetical protein
VISRASNPFNGKALTIDFNASLNDDSAYHSLSLAFLPCQSAPVIRGCVEGFYYWIVSHASTFGIHPLVS